jgi:cell fate regulator YaaT (PSP1 superfamily)
MSEQLKLAIKLRKFNRVCPITGYKEETIKIGAPVIVQTDRGIEFGEIVNYMQSFSRVISKDVRLKKVVRYATPEDLQKEKEIPEIESKAFIIAVQKVKEHEAPLKIVSLEYLFDLSRAFIYFRVEEGKKNPNLRDYSRDLAAALSIRIEMKQLSPRDEARLFGGMGPCGRPLCCSVWLEKPKHVTVKMVKEQGVAVNPTKTSGVCGRLMCCFEYEHLK